MTCCTYRGNKTYTLASLVFRREEIIYDARDISYIIGDTLPSEAQHVRHLVQDIANEENLPFAMRVLNLAHRECVEMLFRFTCGDIPEHIRAGDNRLTEPNYYIIFLRLPPFFSRSTLELLEPAVHDYMVARLLYEWFLLVYPDKAEMMAAKVAAAKERIESIINHRTGRARLRLCPPW